MNKLHHACSLIRLNLLVKVALACALGFHASAANFELRSATNHVGTFGRIEFDLNWNTSYTNPFNPDEVQADLIVQAPGQSQLTIPAFWHQPYERRQLGRGDQRRDWMYPVGMPRWKACFCPTAPGEYTATAEIKDRTGTHRSSPVVFACSPATNPGFLRVSQKDPRFLEFSDGSPFFAIGQNLAFIGNQQYVKLWKAEEIFEKLNANGANYLRIWTCCEDWAMAIEARKSAWGRSWNFKAPIVDTADASGSRKCLRLSAGATLKAEPSHPVALKPNTRYAVTGRLRGDAGIRVELKVSPGSLADTIELRTTDTWDKFSAEFTTGEGDYWLNELSLRVAQSGSALLDELSLREASGSPELLWEADVNRQRRGVYNPIDCFMLDELLVAAERHGQYLQLCMLTRDLYMDALKDEASSNYNTAIADAKKFFRYAVGRWGAFTSVAAWEYWNEMNPGLPTDRFYTELGNYLAEVDVYRHLRTTSTWGPSAKDYRHPELDIADTHFYLRPTDKARLEDEVHAVLERTAWLRQQAPQRPAHLGELGLADDQWRITPELRRSAELADIHNALWASALSGASGTALSWWWERLDERDACRLYRPLSRFIADVPWNGGQVQTASVTCARSNVRVFGLTAGPNAWLWCFNKEASWSKLTTKAAEPSSIPGLTLELQEAADQTRTIEWWDTAEGSILRTEIATPVGGILRVRASPFARDVAVRIRPGA